MTVGRGEGKNKNEDEVGGLTAGSRVFLWVAGTVGRWFWLSLWPAKHLPRDNTSNCSAFNLKPLTKIGLIQIKFTRPSFSEAPPTSTTITGGTSSY